MQELWSYSLTALCGSCWAEGCARAPGMAPEGFSCTPAQPGFLLTPLSTELEGLVWVQLLREG